MNERDLLRINGKPKQSNIVNRTTNISNVSKEYIRNLNVDFDVVFCVSSYNRFDKLTRLLEQVYDQESKYKFKFILLNDGSTDIRYNDLKYMYPDIIYLKNEVNGGKLYYWKTINKLWGEVSKLKTNAVIQLDDDFVLCNTFLDRLLDVYYNKKSENNHYMIINFHLYNFSRKKPIESWWFDENEVFVDGGMIIDTQFLELNNYALEMSKYTITLKTSSFVWVWVKDKLIELGLKVYRTRKSLVWHDGNDDSKLHPNVRAEKRVYTKNFIDNDLIYNKQ